MEIPTNIHTTLGALIAGGLTSVHCLGMCGPLACGVASLGKSESQRLVAICAYHCSRLFSYALIGSVCAALGKQPLQAFFYSPAVVLPWLVTAFLVIYGLGLNRRLPRPPVLMATTWRLRLATQKLSPLRAGLALGSLTPLLPCGPLYLLFGACLVAGSAARGAEFAIAFGIGTLPLMWFTQQHLARLRQRLSPPLLGRVQRGLALVTALVLIVRLHDTLPWQPPRQPSQLPTCCPKPSAPLQPH